MTVPKCRYEGYVGVVVLVVVALVLVLGRIGIVWVIRRCRVGVALGLGLQPSLFTSPVSGTEFLFKYFIFAGTGFKNPW